MKIAVYPGSFDPITYGHLDVIQRAKKVADKLIVAVVRRPSKQTIFSAEERMAMVKEGIKGLQGVEVSIFDGLLVDYARSVGAQGIVRGLRALSDFDYEFQMALTNRKLCDQIETIFLMSNEAYSYLSSSIIKDVARLGGDLSAFVPPFVGEKVREKFRK